MSPSSGCALALLLWAPLALAQAPAAAAPTGPPVAADPPPAEIILSPSAPTPEPTPAPPPSPAAPTAPAAPEAELEPRASVDVSSRAPAQPLPDAPRDFNLELGLGMNGRFGDASGYSSGEGLGAAYGAGFWFTVNERIALGLELAHIDLGHASAKNGANFVDAEYANSAAWLSGRFVAFQTRQIRLFAAIRLGLALEHVAATGTRAYANPVAPAVAFDCSGTHGPAFALGAGIGALVHINAHLDFVSRLDGHAEQLTGDIVGGCVAGIGSVTSLAFGVGLAYGFDGPSYKGDPFAGRRRLAIGSR